MGLNWLITGGCGFLGVNLIDRLQREGGHKIVVLDNLSVGSRDDLLLVTDFSEITTTSGSIFENKISVNEVGLFVGDIMDQDAAFSSSIGANVIVHFAANTGVGPSIEDPKRDLSLNVMGTFQMLEAARWNNVSRFVLASSGAPAGNVEPPIHENLAPRPLSPYGASKLAGEGYCSAYFNSFDVQTVCLRFGNVYGPRSAQKGSVVAKFIKEAFDGQDLEVYGDGLQTRDFIFVEDLVEAVIKVTITENIGGEVFQIATQSETTISELLSVMESVFDEFDLTLPNIVYSEPRRGDIRRNYSDTTKARRMLGWQAKTKLADGLRITLQYFLERK